GERDDEVSTEGVGDASKGVDAVARPSTLLKAGDDRLRRSHPLRELALAEPGFGAQVVDELAQREILLNAGPRPSSRLSPLLLHIIPAGVIGHGRLLHGYRSAHAAADLRARLISARSLLRCLRKVVSRTTRPSLVNR